MEFSWVKRSLDMKGVRDGERVLELEVLGRGGWSKNYSQNTKGGDPKSQEMLVRVGYMILRE